ncbi:precorrin-3B synthase [Methylobacterium mesophilicum SR1.6/6]|uniref:Precorrin-3B synthase n=2 Tax=Methylobacterium mesophilicum TaxID=39956 RepID=A0A6B9FU47_9HYPH|nr:precorrin-3B synthase [Methylobacterium mesophilicum SR1.6/6]
MLPEAPARRNWCPGLARPMPTGDGLLARVHPPLGILTLDQARAVAEGARRFGNGHLDLTARANIQIRGVTEATRAPLADLLGDVGLGDVRADGGPQRLTLTSPLAGRDPDELVDVPRLARAIEAAGLDIPGLPAKTLVVVTGRRDTALPEADCSVIARGPAIVAIAIESGQGLRDIATCGEGEAPGLIGALLAAFARTGRRRMRDLSDDERTALAETLDVKVLAQDPARCRETEPGGISRSRVPFAPTPGRHEGNASQILVIDAPFGRCTADAFDRIVVAAVAIGASEIRLSPARGFVLSAAADVPAPSVLEGLADAFITAPDDPRNRIDACTGAPGCASGSTPTLADAGRLAGALDRDVSAHVSGCAKGCARPGPAELTLVGRDGFYGIIIGGAPGDEPAWDLPIEAVLERLGRAKTVGLAAAFAPDTAATEFGRTRRPA